MIVNQASDVLEFVKKSASQKFITENCLYLTRAGSKSYNTHISTSDDDIKGVTLAPKKYHYGFMNNFDQYEHKDPDIVIMGLQKYVSLMANNNPNIVETLFVSPEDVLFVHPAFQRLIDNRDKILTKQCYHSFSGYARGQLRRCRLHKGFNDQNPVKPNPEDYGIVINNKYKSLYQTVNAEIQKEIDKSMFNGFTNQIAMTHKFYEVATTWKLSKDKIWENHLERFTGGTEEVYQKLIAYKKYFTDLEDYNKFVGWQKNRNVVRAKNEKELGYDSKFAYHVIRLTKMCQEILSEGKVLVKRIDDRDLFIDIRNGKYSYEEFLAMAQKLLDENETAYKNSKLPDEVDREFFDDLVISICDELL